MGQSAVPEDRLDQQLLPVFLDEAETLYPRIEAALQHWRSQPEDVAAVRALSRILHTFKGSAQMAGAMRIGELAHRIEARVEEAAKQGRADNFQFELNELAALLVQLNELKKGLPAESVPDIPTRTQPFASLSGRFKRVVQQAAQELGKSVRLELIGGEQEMDASLLEKLAGPIEHLLRNAVVHGIESPVLRAVAGKPAQGEVKLSLQRQSAGWQIGLSDDGAGLNRMAIVSRAIELGLLGPKLLELGTSVSDQRLAQLIWLPGFSTVTAPTLLAGRGIGLDVVRNDIEQLGGQVSVTWQAGEGTQFFIQLKR